MLMPTIFIRTGSWCRKSAAPLGERADRRVRVVETGLSVEPGVPAAAGVAGNGDRAFVERLAVVVELGQVEVGDRAPALAPRAHATGDVKLRRSFTVLPPRSN